jgi:hypothetical protein
MMQVVSLLLAIFKAVPQLKKWWDSLTVAYLTYQDIKLDKEIRVAIKKAINDHDQRDLEEAMRSTKTGEASGKAGTIIRPSRPH